MRQIAAHFGWSSMTAALEHIENIIAKGWLTSTPGKVRSLQLVKPGASPPISLRVPVFDRLPNDLAACVSQGAGDFLSVTVDMIGYQPTRHTFALRVKDDSMNAKHLCPGDIVVLEHGEKPRSGNIVAALIGQETVLKTFLKKRGQSFLQSDNSKSPEIIPAETAVIQGVFKALIRRFD